MLKRLSSKSWRASVAEELQVGPRALQAVLPWLVRTKLKRVTTVLDVVMQNASERPHDLAFEMDDQHLTWSDLERTTSRVAYALADAGVTSGAVVALMAENSPFYIAAVLGITRVGATAALINTNLKGRPLSHAINAAGAKTIMVGDSLEPAIRDCEPLQGEIDQILVFDADPNRGLLADTPMTNYPPAQVESADDFVYIYTSGTTGLPKPCRISHERALLAGAGFGPLMFRYSPGDKLYCVLPLYHSSGLLLGAVSAILAQVPTALRGHFSASAFWQDVHHYQATAILYIGELCRYLVNAPPDPRENPNPIRVAVGNGLRPDVWPQFQSRFGIDQIREFYGATEAPGLIANLSGREGSVGRVPFGGGGFLRLVRYDVDRDDYVRDDRGYCVPCEIGEPGELLIKISSISGGLEYRGYTDDEASQKKILRDVFKKGDSYFRSGDLLRRDAEGFYYFVDRIGDTFRWKGENVSTAEVADVIAQSSMIAEATVTGVHVPNMEGQAGLAAVVTVGDFDPDAFWEAVEDLPSYAQPRFVRVMSNLAKTSTFKIQKTALQKDGVDPSTVPDALYVRTEAGYEALTPELWSQIRAGTIKL